MANVWIPALLRPLSGGREVVHVTGRTVAEAILDLERTCPGIRVRLLDGDQPRPGLAILVDGDIVRGGLDQTVRPESEVHFIHAIGGG